MTALAAEIPSDTSNTPLSTDPWSASPIPKKLETLAREIHAAYENELTAIARRVGRVDDTSNVGAESLRPKTIRELLEAGNHNNNPQGNSDGSRNHPILSSMKLNVIRSWKDLLDALVKHNVFLDYSHAMNEAFREVEETPPPEEATPQTAMAAAMVWFRHQWNLVKLLTHTVVNHFRDNSTECRFVTLLEVTLSYQKAVVDQQGDSKVVYQWKPSNAVQRFWVRLMQPIDPEMAPFDFRRKAYGVLVSLSWVPSSKGLLEACSIADSRRGELPPNTPLETQRILSMIPSRPLSRNDCVYQVLDRLKDETNVSVVITASSYNKVAASGIGTTTVAALVASHPLIVRSFKVLWLNMDYRQQQIMAIPDVNNPITKERERKARLDYETYIRYLNKLCDQLGCSPQEGGSNHDENEGRWTRKRPVWPEAHSLKRLEEPAIRHRREVHLMRKAKRLMTKLVESTGTNILLILDDVTEDEELQSFHFTDKQSLLATTRHDIQNADFTVELDPWGEEESIELFLLEAQCPELDLLASSAEVKQLVSRCHYHPIIVRTAARFFMLKKVTSGLVQALEETNREFCDGFDDDSAVEAAARMEDADELDSPNNQKLAPTVPKALSKLLDKILSPTVRRTRQPSILFKLCLASMAAVFAECQPVPLTAVLLLWEQLLTMEPDAIDEIGGEVTAGELRRRAWFIAEGLTHIGLLSFSEGGAGDAFVAIHHEMYVAYALDLVKTMNLGESADGTFVQWHKAFVASYLTRKFEGNNCDSSHAYALQNLSKHMLYCKLYVQSVALLSNGRLYQERVAAFGRERATALHVKDCIQLMRCIKGDPKIPRDQRDEVATEHFQKVAALLTQNMDLSKESSALSLAKDLYAIGFGLAENEKYAQALDLYTQAHGLVPKSSSFAATLLYGLGSLNLILNDYGKAVKCLMASIASMKILGEDGESGSMPRNSLYLAVSRLHGEALMAQCNYKLALTQFEECTEMAMEDDGFESEVENSMVAYRRGCLHQIMGDNDLAEKELTSCIKWKEKTGEVSRNLAAAHGALADVYAEMTKSLEARQHIDLALKTLKQVDAKFPKLRYDDEEELDVEELLLTAKLRTLRPDLEDDLTNYSIIRKKLVESPVLLMDKSAYDLRFIALAYMASDEHEQGVSILEDALNIMSNRKESLERAQCLLCLGNSFVDQSENYEEDEKKARTMFELAMKLFDMALNIQRAKLGDSNKVLETLDAIGNLHVHLGRHERAISVYTGALALGKKINCDVEKLAGILYFLGECSEALFQLGPAEKYYKKCLEGLRSDRPSNDIDLARPLQRLGAMSLITSKYEDAKQLYDEILTLREANFDHDDVMLAETRDVLGFIEIKRQKYESAEKFLQGALEIRLQHEDNKRAVGDTHFQIGLTFRMRGEHENAMSCFEKSLATLEGVVTKEDPIMANVDLAMGNTFLNLGKLEQAAKRCQQALVMRRSTLGPDHRKTANASRSLGMTKFLAQDDLDDACFLLQEYARICESIKQQSAVLPLSVDHSPKPNEYAAALIMLSDIQVANGRHKLARKILITARDVCQTRQNEKTIRAHRIPPELDQMVQKRLAGLTAASTQEGKLNSDLKLDPKEAQVFQKIILSDD